MSTERTPWEGAPVRPRAWQAEALPLVVDAIRGNRRGLVGVVTGGGKSILQAEIVNLAIPKAERLGRVVVVVAPRQALVVQLAATIARRVGAELVGQFFANRKDSDRLVIVCCGASLPRLAATLEAKGRACSMLVIDEAHNSEAKELKAAIAVLAPLRVVGFTATPYRSDEREALGLFDQVVYRYGYREALRDGVLVPFVPVNYDGEGVDDCDDVCRRMILEHAHGPGIVSATSIPDAEEHAAYLSERGIPAAAIHSKVPEPERVALLERLRVGELRALVHVALLAEGVDLPWLRWLCLRRPVQARVRFVQELGRVLRVIPAHEPWAEQDRALWGEKKHAVVMDPHALLQELGITHAERLGEVEEALAEAEGKKAAAAEREAQIKALPRATAISELSAFAQAVVVQLAKAGIAFWNETRPDPAEWPATPRQVEYLRDLRPLCRMLPEHIREPFKVMIDRAHDLGYNTCAAMIESLRGVRMYTREARRAHVYKHLPPSVIEAVPEVSQLHLAAFKRST